MKKKLWILIVLTALLILDGLWYTRPLSLEELFPGADVTQCTGIQVRSCTWEDQGLFQQRELTPSDPDFQALIELLEGRSFRRSLWRTLFQDKHGLRQWRENDYVWNLCLAFENVPASDGEQSGYMLEFDSSFGALSIQFLGQRRLVQTADQARWQADILSVVRNT